MPVIPILMPVYYENKSREKAVLSIAKYLSKPSLLQLDQKDKMAIATKCAVEIE